MPATVRLTVACAKSAIRLTRAAIDCVESLPEESKTLPISEFCDAPTNPSDGKRIS